MKRIALLALVLVLALAAAGSVHAQSGGTFELTWFSVDGGGEMNLSGGTFALGSTAGQPDAAVLTGGTFGLQGGFWLCVTAAPITTDINANSADIVLSWTAIEATANIYRSENNPYFNPGAAYATGVTSIWTDPGVAGNPALNQTYIIRAQGPCGESANSQRLGEFGFALTPGS